MKLCRGCNIEKELTDFPKDGTKPDGHTSRCLFCKVSYNRQWRIQVNSNKKHNKVNIHIHSSQHIFNNLSN